MFTFLSLTFSFIIQKYAKIRLLFCKSNQSLGQSMSIYMDISVFITVYQQSLRKFLLHTLFALVAVQSQVVSDSFVIPWTVAHHVHLHGFPRQVYCSGLPFPSLGDLCRPGIESISPVLAGRLLTTEPLGKPSFYLHCLSSNQK